MTKCVCVCVCVQVCAHVVHSTAVEASAVFDTCTVGKLMSNQSVAESINTDWMVFGLVDLCQPHTNWYTVHVCMYM